MKTGWRRRCQAAPADVSTRMLKSHGASRQIPDDVPQGRHPVGAEDDVVARQGHDEEVDAELQSVDADLCLTEDARA